MAERPPEEIERLRQELLTDHPDLGHTTWTWEQMVAAEQATDEHVDDCNECQEALDDEPPTSYCPVGESLIERAGIITLEYSWQPDFPKRDDPRWRAKR